MTQRWINDRIKNFGWIFLLKRLLTWKLTIILPPNNVELMAWDAEKPMRYIKDHPYSRWLHTKQFKWHPTWCFLVFMHLCWLWTHPVQCAHTSLSQTCTVDVLYKVPINLSHDSCIRHEQRDCAILTRFFVLLHSLCYKTNILLIYNYELHVFLFSKSVLVREGCLFSLEHEAKVIPQEIKLLPMYYWTSVVP